MKRFRPLLSTWLPLLALYPNATAPHTTGTTRRHHRDIALIGASPGGATALPGLKTWPADFLAPVLVVQHVATDPPGTLPQLLSSVSALTARHPKTGRLSSPASSVWPHPTTTCRWRTTTGYSRRGNRRKTGSGPPSTRCSARAAKRSHPIGGKLRYRSMRGLEEAKMLLHNMGGRALRGGRPAQRRGPVFPQSGADRPPGPRGPRLDIATAGAQRRPATTGKKAK